MDNQTPETRIKLLEGRMANAEERITTHGKEIDALVEQQVRTQERDAFRDRQMASIETKVDRMDGKIDLLATKPAEKSAEKWDKATWVVVSVVLTAAITALLSRISF